MKWFLYLAILGLFLTRIEGQSEFSNEVESSEPPEMQEVESSDPAEPSEMQEVESSDPAEPPEMQEVESSDPAEPPEMQEVESSDPVEPPEMQEVESSDPTEIIPPQDIQPSESDGTFQSSVPAGQAVQSSSALILGGGGGDESNSEEVVGQGAAMNNAELAGGDSSQEDVAGGVDGGAGLGGVPVDSEEVTNAIGNEIGTEPIPTQLIQSTVGYIVSTGSPIIEATNIINPNRGDAFFADFGPQEGAKDRQGSEPGDTESAASPQKIGLIVGATTAGTVAVAAGLAIAYVKLKGAGSAAAGGV